MIIHWCGLHVPYKIFKFPDGQLHFELLESVANIGIEGVTFEAHITSADELFAVLLAKNAFDASNVPVSLDIRYLMGARMDRRINVLQPATLDVVARQLVGAGFLKIRVLDPHSAVSLALLGAEAVYPLSAVKTVLSRYSPHDTVIIIPDDGATARVQALMRPSKRYFQSLQGHKRRESQTGALSGFEIDDIECTKSMRCLILDDICDGGGTFVGLARMIRAAGAVSVDLFVTHGIFSKGLPLDEIDKVYTTDSCRPYEVMKLYANISSPDVVIIPVTMG